MKKIMIASLVGAIMMFIYQALSWMVLPIHQNSLKYTPHQDSVLRVLDASIAEDGMYYVPNSAPGTSMEEQEKMREAMEGKPWAMIYFHKSHHHNMGIAMGLGFLYNFISMIIASIILQKAAASVHGFGSRWLLLMGLAVIIVLQSELMNWNWWQTPGHYLWGEVADDILAWALSGLWLAWYMGRQPKKKTI